MHPLDRGENLLRARTMRVVAYGRDDGLPNVDYIFGFKSTAVRLRDGRLWFATTRGALEIRPEPAPDRGTGGSLVPVGGLVAGQTRTVTVTVVQDTQGNDTTPTELLPYQADLRVGAQRTGTVLNGVIRY